MLDPSLQTTSASLKGAHTEEPLAPSIEPYIKAEAEYFSDNLNPVLIISEIKSEIDRSSEESVYDNIFIRVAEVFAATCLIIVLSPVLILISALIAFWQRGSIVYSQQRVGLGGNVFKIFKFRTMYLDAEKDGPFICDSYEDKRITSLGRFLRRSKLDELPQLINIIRGEMTFVGPRPERPNFHIEFSCIPGWERRITVKPGITGLAQVDDKISHAPSEKIKLDLKYIDNKSFFLNLKILARTALIMLT